MDHVAPGLAEKNLRVLQSGDALEGTGWERLAALHLKVLPGTAASRAGREAVAELYRAVLREPGGPGILVHALVPDGPPAGAFALGTTDLRKTESSIRRHLRGVPGTAIRLAFCNLLAPWHALARFSWERRIPEEHIGYILTIGATPGSPVRGKEVLCALEDGFAGRNMIGSWVDTEASNRNAIRFYEKNGYGILSRRFGQVLMRKELAGGGVHPPVRGV